MNRLDNIGEHSVTRNALRGKRVLITGTTGYLGKVILEKIIREIPDVGGVNLIIRGNKHFLTAEKRFKAEILTSSIFDHLRETDPEALNKFCDDKLNCVSGEITEDQFGLSESDYAKLAANTDVFVNSAASVNFHEALDVALKINTLCLNNVADFAKDAGDIPVVQISTCYVNGYNNGVIREGVSEPASGQMKLDNDGYYDIQTVFTRLQQKIDEVKAAVSKDNMDEALTELGLKEANYYGWGDTYTFTKWLGEQLILKRMKGQTISIVRPSIVESCWQEPKAGWIEGVKVTDAILLAYARGKVSMFPAREAGVLDIIPVDLVSNSVILTIAETLIDPNETRIYQACSGSQNPLNVARFAYTVCDEVRDNWEKYPLIARKKPKQRFKLVNKTMFVGIITAVKLAYTIAERLRFRSSANKSAGLKKIESTLKLTNIYAYYTSPFYEFNSDKLMTLANRMGARDKQLFPVDAAIIDWDVYLKEIHITGLNKYGIVPRK